MKTAFLISRPRRSLARRTQQEEEPKIDSRGVQSEDQTHYEQFEITSRLQNLVKIYLSPLFFFSKHSF